MLEYGLIETSKHKIKNKSRQFLEILDSHSSNVNE